MPFKVFTLEDIKCQKNINWCWCSCIEWIIQAFDIDIKYKKQWQILYRYLELKGETDSLQWDKTYIKETYYSENIEAQEIRPFLNSLLKEHVNIEEFTPLAINSWQENERIIREALNFNNIKTGINNNTVYLIFTNQHLMLINGYGYINSCEYFLLCNPFYAKEYYYLNKSYIEENYTDILGIWSVTCSNIKKLINDTEIESVIEYYFENEESLKLSNINNPIDFLKINTKIHNQIYTHNNNSHSSLKEAIISIVKNYQSDGTCARRIKKPKEQIINYNKTIQLEGTRKIIKSFKNSRDFNFNNFKIYDYKNNEEANIEILLNSNHLKIKTHQNNQTSNYRDAIKTLKPKNFN